MKNRVYQGQVLELDNEAKSVFKIKLGPQIYRILCLEKYPAQSPYQFAVHKLDVSLTSRGCWPTDTELVRPNV